MVANIFTQPPNHKKASYGPDEWIIFLSKTQKPYFWVILDFFGPVDSMIFSKIRFCHFSYFDYLTSCKKKKSGKNTDPILRSCIANRQMGMDRGRQKNRVKFIGPVFLTQVISRQQKNADATKIEIMSAIFKKLHFAKYSIKRCCR